MTDRPSESAAPTESMAHAGQTPPGGPTLRRAVGLWLLVFYGLGTIIGAGIYVLVGAVARQAGTATPAAFGLAGLLAAFTGLSYAELAARYPEAAGAAAYVKEAFGADWLSRLVGFAVVLVGLLMTASLARGAVGYIEQFAALPEVPTALALVVLFTLVAAVGVRASLTFAAVLTLVEIAGLALVVGVGAPALAGLPAAFPDLLLPGPELWPGVAAGAFLAFFAFLGFEDIVNMAEEVREPERTLPRAVVLSIVLSTAIYIVVSTVVMLAVPIDRLAGARAPLELVLEDTAWVPRGTVAVVALIAIPNGILITLLMLARVLYGMARRGWLPEGLGRVNVRTRTPLRTTFLAGGLALVFTAAIGFVGLVALTSALSLAIFAVVNLALIRLHRAGGNSKGGRRPHIEVPYWCPYMGAATCLALLGLELLG